MNLTEVIQALDRFDRADTICAKVPWTEASDAVVVRCAVDAPLPRDLAAEGYRYFLEVSVARELVGALDGGSPAALGDRVRLVTYYAENDAYPEWFYERGRDEPA